MTARLKKSTVLAFINEKEREVLANKTNPLKAEYQRLKDEHYDSVLKNSGANTEEFRKLSGDVASTLTNLRDELDYNNYDLIDTIRTLSKISNGEKPFTNNISYTKIDVVREAEEKYSGASREIREEFSKIRSMLKSLSTGNQGRKMLQELGFDVSELTPSKKNEVMALNINSSLLGLPEQSVN